jgi:ABC-type multidrug transport system ATPase subunit
MFTRCLTSSPSPSALLLSTILLLVLYASTSVNADCAADEFCYNDAVEVTNQVTCIAGQWCPGEQGGQICTGGYFCATPLTREICPSGTYCPPGSIQPRDCSPLATCPEGSDRYFHFGALIFLLILLPVLAAAPWLYHRYNQRSRRVQLAAVDSTKTLNGQNTILASSAQSTQQLLPPVPRMEVAFSNVCAVIDVHGTEKVILRDITGHFRPGRLAAIMGPSGAGKSSLISVLTGQVKLKSGEIAPRIEGELQNDLRLARAQGLIGVVPQADVMLTCLTPRDILTHAAFSRLPSSWTSQQKHARVSDVLRILGLTRVQHTPVGDQDTRGISGGEAKRTSVGIELINTPSLLILDEPTSGLDSASSNSLINTLHTIAQSQQSTVVAVLHQPRQEAFAKFDDLLLLAPGGLTVYFGPAAATQQYFESIGYKCDVHTNLADYVIDVIAGKAGPPIRPVDPSSLNGSSCSPANMPHQFPDELLTSFNVALHGGDALMIQDYLVAQWNGPAGKRFRLEEETPHTPASPTEVRSAEKGIIAQGEHQSNRSPFKPDGEHPNWFTLTYLYAYRGLLQCFRSISTIQIEVFMYVLAGSVIGMAFVDENWFIPPISSEYVEYCPEPFSLTCRQEPVRDVLNLMGTYTVMALGLVCAIIGNRCYGEERANIQREGSGGMSFTAYFIGKSLAEIPVITVYAFVYCVSFWLVCSPASEFGRFYAVILLFCLTLFGIGYVSSFLFASTENALLCSAVSALLGGLATDNQSPEKNVCWSRWAAEALFLSEARADLLPQSVESMLATYLYTRNKFELDMYGTDLLVLVIMAVTLRVLAFALMYRRFKQ